MDIGPVQWIVDVEPVILPLPEHTDGTGMRRITPHGPHGDSAASPDGTEILFGSDRSLSVVDPGGTNLSQIPEDPCAESEVEFFADSGAAPSCS